MIVRVSGEDQYRLGDEGGEKVHELDRAVVEVVEAGDEGAFKQRYDALLAYVRDHGEPLGEDELEPSDLILPPPDISFEEAAEEFSGEGLIPD